MSTPRFYSNAQIAYNDASMGRRDRKFDDEYKKNKPVFSVSMQIMGQSMTVFLQRRNECCINTFLLNEVGQMILTSFFNENSPYAKSLKEEFKTIDYTKL